MIITLPITLAILPIIASVPAIESILQFAPLPANVWFLSIAIALGSTLWFEPFKRLDCGGR